jgi:septal ring factor EnvC (AmiA/AmiB activator)
LKSAAESSNNPNYVQSLETDLQNTRNLLTQYKKRTEQLMELVKKQTSKINELREQLNSKP